MQEEVNSENNESVEIRTTFDTFGVKFVEYFNSNQGRLLALIKLDRQHTFISNENEKESFDSLVVEPSVIKKFNINLGAKLRVQYNGEKLFIVNNYKLNKISYKKPPMSCPSCGTAYKVFENFKLQNVHSEDDDSITCLNFVCPSYPISSLIKIALSTGKKLGFGLGTPMDVSKFSKCIVDYSLIFPLSFETTVRVNSLMEYFQCLKDVANTIGTTAREDILKHHLIGEGKSFTQEEVTMIHDLELFIVTNFSNNKNGNGKYTNEELWDILSFSGLTTNKKLFSLVSKFHPLDLKPIKNKNFSKFATAYAMNKKKIKQIFSAITV